MLEKGDYIWEESGLVKAINPAGGNGVKREVMTLNPMHTAGEKSCLK